MYRLEQIDETNMSVYERLSQNYEAEFSSITGKNPDMFGLYAITPCDASHWGYLCWDESGTPVGFALFIKLDSCFDGSEFYIIPSKRRSGFGMRFAMAVFDQHPGPWQVRQIEGADAAYAFWKSTIAQYTQSQFSDGTEADPEWGIVRIQRFNSRNTGIPIAGEEGRSKLFD